MGIPLPPKASTPMAGTKRPPESAPSPDTKRPRTQQQPPQPSPRISQAVAQSSSGTPKLTPKAPAVIAKRESTTPQLQSSPVMSQPPAPAPVTQSPMPGAQPATSSSSAEVKPIQKPVPAAQTADSSQQHPAKFGPQEMQKFSEMMALNEMHLAQQMNQVKFLLSQGKHAEAQALREKVTLLSAKAQHIKTQVTNRYRLQSKDAEDSISATQGSSSPSKEAVANGTPQRTPVLANALPHVPATVAAAQPPMTQPTASSPPHPPPHIPPHAQIASPNMGPPAGSPQMNAQMVKVMEQHKRTPHMSNAAIPPEPVPAMAKPTPPGQPSHWRGLFTWSGSDSGTHVRREMQASVIMAPMPAKDGQAMYVICTIRISSARTYIMS